MKSSLRSAVLKAGVAILAGATVTLSGGAMALAAGTNSGTALIQTPGGVNLNSGGSQVDFTVKLPAGAACSGDTANGKFHVYGYIVDSTAVPNPGTLTFAPGIGPSSGFPLVDNTGSAYVDKPTALNTGQVPNPNGPFNWKLFSIDGRAGTGTLPAGTYNVGIACATATGAGDKFWNSQVTFTANGTDPNGEVWATVPNPQVPEFPYALALPLSALVILGGGVLVVRRRRSAAVVAA